MRSSDYQVKSKCALVGLRQSGEYPRKSPALEPRLSGPQTSCLIAEDASANQTWCITSRLPKQIQVQDPRRSQGGRGRSPVRSVLIKYCVWETRVRAARLKWGAHGEGKGGWGTGSGQGCLTTRERLRWGSDRDEPCTGCPDASPVARVGARVRAQGAVGPRK